MMQHHNKTHKKSYATNDNIIQAYTLISAKKFQEAEILLTTYGEMSFDRALCLAHCSECAADHAKANGNKAESIEYYKEAQKRYERVIQIHPENKVGYIKIINLCVVRENYEKALEYTHSGLKQWPKNTKMHLREARVLERINTKQSIEKYQQIIKEFGAKCPEAYLEEVKVRENAGMIDKVEVCYELENIIKSMKFTVNDAPELYKIYALYLSLTKRNREALSICESLIKFDTEHKYLDVRITYGRTLADMGRASDAEQVFEKLLEICPQNIPTFKNAKITYAIFLNEAGDYKRAREIYQSMQPKTKESYLGLAINTTHSIEENTQEKDSALKVIAQAMSYIKQALKLDSEYDSAWSALGHCYNMLADINASYTEAKEGNGPKISKGGLKRYNKSKVNINAFKCFSKAAQLKQSRLNRHKAKVYEPMVEYIDKTYGKEIENFLKQNNPTTVTSNEINNNNQTHVQSKELFHELFNDAELIIDDSDGNLNTPQLSDAETANDQTSSIDTPVDYALLASKQIYDVRLVEVMTQNDGLKNPSVYASDWDEIFNLAFNEDYKGAKQALDDLNKKLHGYKDLIQAANTGSVFIPGRGYIREPKKETVVAPDHTQATETKTAVNNKPIASISFAEKMATTIIEKPVVSKEQSIEEKLIDITDEISQLENKYFKITGEKLAAKDKYKQLKLEIKSLKQKQDFTSALELSQTYLYKLNRAVQYAKPEVVIVNSIASISNKKEDEKVATSTVEILQTITKIEEPSIKPTKKAEKITEVSNKPKKRNKKDKKDNKDNQDNKQLVTPSPRTAMTNNPMCLFATAVTCTGLAVLGAIYTANKYLG